MDIHQSARKTRCKFRGQNPHKAGQYNEVRRLTFQRSGEISVKSLSRRIDLMIDERCWDARFAGDIQTACAGPIANDQRNLATQRARLARRQYGLEVRAPAG
jgi:hypothetical protein